MVGADIDRLSHFFADHAQTVRATTIRTDLCTLDALYEEANETHSSLLHDFSDFVEAGLSWSSSPFAPRLCRRLQEVLAEINLLRRAVDALKLVLARGKPGKERPFRAEDRETFGLLLGEMAPSLWRE